MGWKAELNNRCRRKLRNAAAWFVSYGKWDTVATRTVHIAFMLERPAYRRRLVGLLADAVGAINSRPYAGRPRGRLQLMRVCLEDQLNGNVAGDMHFRECQSRGGLSNFCLAFLALRQFHGYARRDLAATLPHVEPWGDGPTARVTVNEEDAQ